MVSHNYYCIHEQMKTVHTCSTSSVPDKIYSATSIIIDIYQSFNQRKHMPELSQSWNSASD